MSEAWGTLTKRGLVMGRVLIGWELGAGLGHVRRLLAVARGLAAHGHRPIFVVRNLVEPGPVLSGERFPVLQAPMYPPRPRSKPFKAAAISDIFATQGFDNPDELLCMVEAWQRLIDLTRPELIISDYSPTLSLAAFGVNPMVIVGDGFTMPPSDLSSFPLLRPSVPITMPQDRILAVVREVQWRRKRPAPETLPGLFAADARFVCTLHELDPYRRQRKEKVLGPFERPPPPAPLPEKPRFFAYLASDHKSTYKAARGLADIEVPGSFFIRRAPSSLVRSLRQKGFTVYETPAPLAEVLKDATTIIHHGGIGTTEVAVGVGRPQIILPRHLEQQLTARALVELGVGKACDGNFVPEAVANALRVVVDEPAFGQRAVGFAERLGRRKPADNVQKIVETCRQILSGGRSARVG